MASDISSRRPVWRFISWRSNLPWPALETTRSCQGARNPIAQRDLRIFYKSPADTLAQSGGAKVLARPARRGDLATTSFGQPNTHAPPRRRVRQVCTSNFGRPVRASLADRPRVPRSGSSLLPRCAIRRSRAEAATPCGLERNRGTPGWLDLRHAVASRPPLPR